VPADGKTAEAKIDARKLKPFSPEQEWEELLAYSRFLIAERARLAAELDAPCNPARLDFKHYLLKVGGPMWPCGGE
jgi:hypothetical protein